MTEFKCVFVDTAPIIYIVSGCDMFFTNDKQLRQEKELPCMTMDDL